LVYVCSTQIRELELSTKIRKLRGDLTLKEFAVLLNTTHQNIQRYEHGTKPMPEFFAIVRKKLGVNANWFFDDNEEMFEAEQPKELIEKYGKHFKRVPEIALADCGLPATQWEHNEKNFIIVDGLKSYKYIFAVKAAGDSMKPYIEKNDHVVCAEIPFDNIKDYTAVLLLYKSSPGTTEASVKLFYRDKADKDIIMIYSINTKYPPVQVKLDRVQKIYKVVKIIRDVA